MHPSVRGRTIVITGASSGIGEATAVRLARDGARRCLVARRADALTRVQELVRELGGEAWNAATALAPDPTVKWTGRRFRIVGKRLQRRAERERSGEHGD